MKLSDHFNDWEFFCPCCGELPAGYPQGISPLLVEGLERIRFELDRPVIVVSGYRCPLHNAELRKKSTQVAGKSQHMAGTAADIIARGVSPGYIAEIAERGPFKHGGVGRYHGWTHVDVRGRKARWEGK